jgi:hypothetical protein
LASLSEDTITIPCPICKAEPGVICQNPSGKKMYDLPHNERMREFVSRPEFDMTVYRMNEAQLKRIKRKFR